MTKSTRYSLATRAIHVGSEPALSASSSVIPDLSLSTTYEQSSVGVHKGFEYSRSSNPNRLALERLIASIEGADVLLEQKLRSTGKIDGWQAGPASLSFSSGSAATATVVSGLAGIGGHVISVSDVYGGTSRYFSVAKIQQQVETTFVEMSYSLATDATRDDAEADDEIVARVKAAIRPNTKVRRRSISLFTMLIFFADDLGGDSYESHSPTRSYRSPRRRCSRSQHSPRYRQYVRFFVLSKSPLARSYRRRALGDEVPQRTFRRSGWYDYHSRAGATREVQIPSERQRERAFPLRLLARHSFAQDFHSPSEAAWSVLFPIISISLLMIFYEQD